MSLVKSRRVEGMEGLPREGLAEAAGHVRTNITCGRAEWLAGRGDQRKRTAESTENDEGKYGDSGYARMTLRRDYFWALRTGAVGEGLAGVAGGWAGRRIPGSRGSRRGR